VKSVSFSKVKEENGKKGFHGEKYISVQVVEIVKSVSFSKVKSEKC